MKYPIPSEAIPFSKRKEINDKILLLIDSGQADRVGSKAIYQAYTGDGGLHGLSFSDFNSYHEFSSAKKEIENGQFFTPAALCRDIVACLPVLVSDLVADITCGKGDFFNFLPVEANIYGCELDTKSFKVAHHLYPEAQIENRDVRYYNPGVKFNYIIGNPPFNLDWNTPAGEMSSQLFFIHKATELLMPGGILAVLVPASFMKDDFMNKSDIAIVEEGLSFICQAALSPKAFSSLGVSSFETKVMFFQRKHETLSSTPYQHDQFTHFDPAHIRSTFIYPAVQAARTVVHKIQLSERVLMNDWSFKNDSLRKSDGFEFQLKKYLYEIKHQPQLSEKLGKALAYIHKYRTQEKPEKMKWEEWDKIKITEPKVLAYLRRIVRSQGKKEKSGFSVYADKFGIRIKPYDTTTRKQLESLRITDLSWNDLVHGRVSIREHVLEQELKPYQKLLARKQAQFELCQTPILDARVSETVRDFLKDYQFVTPEFTTATLNDLQHSDMLRVLGRPYSILSWQMGSGKTVASYGAIQFHLAYSHIRNVFVVAPPIATKGTWIPFLERQGANFVVVRSLSDISTIQRGQIVVIALTTLGKLKRQMMRFVKSINNKALLVFDESDEITNYSSKRSHAVRDVFRRLRYKLLTTGTTTRNNISELYGQLEVLYNNSLNFISDCRVVYREEKGKDADGHSFVEVVSKENPRYNEPFPARGGLQLFKACYAPSKSTVFGIQKHNQDVYNKDSLEKLIARTIITRKFKEIAGDGRYQIHTHKLIAKPFEVELYRQILEELSSIIPNYYRSTGNSRKDAMLRIVRQLQLLIKSCSLPHVMLKSTEKPAKASYIQKMIAGFADEKIMLGSTSVQAASYYADMLREAFPDREVFFVSGESHDIQNRQKVVSAFEKTTNGILVCTQQSLSSSISIPTCSRVIVESLQWNAPKMDQWYFRCIRFTSIRKTHIHFVLYANSIEVNLMALIMAKERLNDFIKTLDLREHSEVMEDFDLDESFLDMIISKVYDDEGSVKFQWGKQKAVA